MLSETPPPTEHPLHPAFRPAAIFHIVRPRLASTRKHSRIISPGSWSCSETHFSEVLLCPTLVTEASFSLPSQELGFQFVASANHFLGYPLAGSLLG